MLPCLVRSGGSGKRAALLQGVKQGSSVAVLARTAFSVADPTSLLWSHREAGCFLLQGSPACHVKISFRIKK